MKEQIQESIKNASCVALATTGPAGINVVPLSIWRVVGEEIFLFDFFMKKTAENLQAGAPASLACWNGLTGVQVKAEVRYQTGGDAYEKAVKEMKQKFPQRTLNGLISLTPTAVYDLSPGRISEKNLLK